MTFAAAIALSTNLHELELIVDKGKETFVEVGLALARIRDAKLYKSTHSSWELYCKQRFGWGKSYADKLARASEVARELAESGTTVPNETQARELARAPVGDRRDVLARAWERAGGIAPTSAHIREIVEQRAANTDPAHSGQLGFGMPGQARRDLSQWDTRQETAAELVRWAGVTKGMRLLEPSAGKGHIVRALVDTGAVVTAVEMDSDRATALRNTLAVHPNMAAVSCGDFLEWGAKLGPGDHFDLVVMNPPYENGQDLAHILAALTLAPWVVVLARLVLLEGQDRREQLWDKHTLRRLRVFSHRESFEGDVDGTPRSAFAAFEIKRGPGQPRIEWWPMPVEG